MRYEYPVELILEQGGAVSVLFPGLPGASWGGDEAEAMTRAADALVTILSGFVDEGRPVPAPGPARGRPVVALGALAAAKVALHNAMLAGGVSNVELAKRLGTDEKTIRRLRDPLHRSHIGQVELALHALGQRLSVEIRRAA